PTQNIRMVQAGDIDGDGKLDLVVANNSQTSTGNLMVFHNASSGPGNINFTLASTVSVPSVRPQAVALADFDGDHKLDAAFADSFKNNPGAVYVVSNQNLTTGGSFPSATKLTMNQPFSQIFVVTADDYNGDGIPDVAAMSNGTNMFVFHGLGNGSFS